MAGLGVRYFGRDVDALAGIDLSLGRGHLVGVAGPNGAGKSTLALGVTGYIPRLIRAETTGTVHVLGADPDPRTAGLVLADPGAQLSAAKTTVREELAFGLENIALPREQMGDRIDRALHDLGIAHLAERHPFSLSGGEQQRVAIASILVMGTSLLVLDEPTAQLDPLATLGVAEVLRERAAAGIGVLVAEHASGVLAGTSRCLVLEGGRIAADDVPGRALAPRGDDDTFAPEAPRLAAALGVDPDRAFDESALAGALAARGARFAPAPVRRAPSPWAGRRSRASASVEVTGLVHRYPSGIEAVRGVDLRVGAGESVAIVGQNGSGKTTLVKHLNGLLRPTAGSVSIGGRSAASARVHELAALVGYVFQDPGDQLFNRTVVREVRFGPRNLGLPELDVDALVTEALEAVGLSGERDTNPYDLDSSARKLVALASVLSMDPAVLVLDEPTTGQDAPGIAAVGRVVESFAAAGRAVIAITHDMAFAARHFARIVVMRAGGVVLDGPPREVFAPSNRDVLASTGLTPPLAARVAARAGRPVALTIDELLTGNTST